MTFAIPLEGLTSRDLPLVGGKAMGCARLMQRRFTVPRGFAITTESFRFFLSQAGLSEKLAAIHQSLNRGDDESLTEAACTVLQSSIRNADLPSALADVIDRFASNLSAPLAVRSSATVEDAADFAFAGIFHSELRVSREKLADAIRDCWAHAVSYQVLLQILRNNLNPAKTGVALLVQEMVAADFAGVLFTDDPTEARPGCALVSLTKGTGEGLMQGDSAGAFIVYDRARRAIVDGEAPAGITPQALSGLFKSGMAIEKAFGTPMDIEWAYAGGTMHYLQARPITTIENRHTRTIHWTRELTEERYPRPISPLGWSLLHNVLLENMQTLSRRFGLVAKHPEEVAKTIRHYVYSNKKFFLGPRTIRPNPFKMIALLPRFAVQLPIILLFALPALISRNGFGLKWLLLSRFFGAFIFPHARDIRSKWERHLSSILREMDAYHDLDYSRMTLGELLDAHRRMDALACRYMEPDLAIYIVKIACSWIIERMGATLRGERYLSYLTDITSGIGENRTLHMNAEIEEMSDFLIARPAIKQLLLDERYDDAAGAIERENPELYARFLRENGHVTTNWDIMESTWGEEPVKIMQMLRGYLVTKRRHSFSDHRDERAGRYEAARDDTILRLRRTPWMTPFFLKVQRYLREFMSIDEEHHFYCSRLFKPLRMVFLEIGKRLADRGVIDSSGDVFFLTIPEIRVANGEGVHFTRRHLVKMRRSSFERSAAVRPPDDYINQTPLARERDTIPEDGSLRGVGASSGIASGPARIVTTTEEAREFREGEILITVAPNPLWTSLFAIAGGLVASTGSILSHGLVSAREYQLPAVIGIADVTSKISNGQRIQVDGDTGIVSFFER